MNKPLALNGDGASAKIDSVCAAIALGGNLGDSQRILSEAIAVLNQAQDIEVIARSHRYRTAPIGPPQPDYINACILVNTTLSPMALLRSLLSVENQFGRVRQERWGARSLDLDLLLYGDRTLDIPGLTIPHPRLHERPFVLVPLVDIAANWFHPVLNKTIEQLLAQLSVTGVERLPAFVRTSHRIAP